MPTEKELKELSKELVLAIDWAAAEYKYLKEFQAELKKIEQEKEIKKELKCLQKAARLLRYLSKAERRAFRFEKEVGKNVYKLLEDKEFSPDLIEGFQVFLKQFKIEENQLAKLASWYSGALDKELDKEKVLLKLEEQIEGKKKEQVHQQFQEILLHLEQSVEQAEEWIRGLEATLKAAQQMWKKLPEEGKGGLREKGYAILKKYGFPIANYPKEAEFMSQYPSDLQEMTQAAGDDSSDLFRLGLPACAEVGLLKPEYWDGLIKMTQAAGNASPDLFGYGLPACAKAGLLKPEYWDGLIKMTQAAGNASPDLFGYGLPACAEAGLIKLEYWEMVVDGLIKMTQAAGNASPDLFGYGLPACAKVGLLKPEYWTEITLFLINIAWSNTQINKMSMIFNNLNQKTIPFVLFLIQNKPKLALEILEKYRLLELLEINFSQELKLFLTIASPITLKEKDFWVLNKIILPFKALDSSTKKFFLSKLNLALRTFQGVELDFLKSLQATSGFEDIGEYSFVELVYVYLKYAQNPEIRFEKLQKSILKIQKEEQKILGLIDGKNEFAQLNPMNQSKLKANLKAISELFFELVLALYTESTQERLANHLEQLFKVKIKNLEEKFGKESFLNTLHLLKRLERDRISLLPSSYRDRNRSLLYSLCFALIQNYLVNKTYPLTKNILECYPWNLPENQAWLKAHIKNKYWYKDFRKEYRTGTEEIKKTNVEERIKHHLQESKRIIAELGLKIGEPNLENIEVLYNKIAGEKLNDRQRALVSDLKTQVSALKSLRGQEQAAQKTGQKIIIQPEFDPLEVLQMGNYVQGSCLSTHGANFWSAVVNAVEVNKRVLWAKDSNGAVLARVLIAIDDRNNIVRFPTYYNTNLLLDNFFDQYLQELAKKCSFGVNGKKDLVRQILSREWYTDSEIGIK